MFAYTIRRVLGLIPVLFGISFLVFLMLRLIPGDPAIIILGERATPRQLAELRAQLGLDKQVLLDFTGERGVFDTQYFNFMSRLLQGDMGTSIIRKTDVTTELRTRFPATIELALAALLISIVLGVGIGVIAATRRASLIDTGSMIIALVGVSIPIFWLGLMMQYLFAVNLRILPISQRIDAGLARNFDSITGMYTIDGLLRGRFDIVGDAALHLLMPALALATVPMAIIVRMTRASMLEVLNQDYVRTAWAKGLAERAVVMRHALRNALLPVITVIGLQLGLLLSGAILTETVFSWPGIGTWLLTGVQARDYPVVQGGVIFVATIFVVVNLLVDLAYAYLDPRISYK
ncbi:MAG: ABC transporter permease [Roseiflexaceae bacterium]